jgi:hypothetical protein
MLSVVNLLFLILFDAVTYGLTLLSIYVLAFYAFFQSLLSRLLGLKVESLDIEDSSIPSLYLKSSTKNYDAALPISSSISHSETKAEAFALKSMFSLKRTLDLKVDNSLVLQDYKLEASTPTLPYILNVHNSYGTNSLSNLLYKQELNYLNTNSYNAKFNKLHLSDLTSTNNSQDAYTSLILENSINSTLSSANATR